MPLQWLELFKDENGRVGRWAVQLANMKYKILYKPGRIHQNADGLSRIQMTSTTHDDESSLDITEKQLADPLCQVINNNHNEGALTPVDTDGLPIRVKEIQLYNNTNGIIIREFLPTSQKRRSEKKIQIVLPRL